MRDRITLSRAKGWRKPPEAIVVTRSTIFGNPWIVGNPGRFWWPKGAAHGWTVEMYFNGPLITADVVRFYRDWLRTAYYPDLRQLTRAGDDALYDDLTARRTLILSRLPDLRGRDLCCTCKQGLPCHATVLMELSNA